MISGHGGDIYGLAQQLGCDPSEIEDMSSNVNPLGPPPELMRHLEDHLDRIQVLPEADAGGMQREFASSCGIDPDQVLAGNGTTQIIYDLPRALGLRDALIVGPTYADYEDSCRQNAIAPRFFHTRESDDFQIDPDDLQARIGSADAVYLCNPNNPTGQLMAPDTIRSICRAFPRTTFVIDESYLPFVPQQETHSLIRQCPANALVLHSLSKIFRIPGLRVGFAVGHADLVARLNRFARPWAVNSLAQSAVHFLLANEALSQAFVRRSQDFVCAERESLTQQLRSIPGINVFSSQTGFFILRLPAPHRAAEICRRLHAEKILIRDCTNFNGLSADFIRISLKSPDVNRKCAGLLRTYFSV
ncbi:MAG: pyridoxal phosphate-dependent class II aminotransferase [Desulfobacterales bacterium]|nr:pyridoxal phosphate-dependent class II aminotransferase [Desulfobacterales bacterium]